MLSRRQAEAASESMLEAGRKQRDRNSPLLLRFPELRDVPFEMRGRMLEAAYSAAWRRLPMLIVASGVVALAGLWLWAVFNDMELAEDFWWAPFLAAVLSHQVSRRLVRWELRRAVARQRARNQ